MPPGRGYRCFTAPPFSSRPRFRSRLPRASRRAVANLHHLRHEGGIAPHRRPAAPDAARADRSVRPMTGPRGRPQTAPISAPICVLVGDDARSHSRVGYVSNGCGVWCWKIPLARRPGRRNQRPRSRGSRGGEMPGGQSRTIIGARFGERSRGSGVWPRSRRWSDVAYRRSALDDAHRRPASMPAVMNEAVAPTSIGSSQKLSRDKQRRNARSPCRYARRS